MPIYNIQTTSTSKQQLAVADPITVCYTCNGSKMCARFSGYPSSASRDAAAAQWLASKAEMCTRSKL